MAETLTLRDHLIQAFYDRSSPDTIETAERAADEFLKSMDEARKRQWFKCLHDDESEYEWIVAYDAERHDFYLKDLMCDEEDWDDK